MANKQDEYFLYTEQLTENPVDFTVTVTGTYAQEPIKMNEQSILQKALISYAKGQAFFSSNQDATAFHGEFRQFMCCTNDKQLCLRN